MKHFNWCVRETYLFQLPLPLVFDMMLTTLALIIQSVGSYQLSGKTYPLLHTYGKSSPEWEYDKNTDSTRSKYKGVAEHISSELSKLSSYESEADAVQTIIVASANEAVRNGLDRNVATRALSNARLFYDKCLRASEPVAALTVVEAPAGAIGSGKKRRRSSPAASGPAVNGEVGLPIPVAGTQGSPMLPPAATADDATDLLGTSL